MAWNHFAITGFAKTPATSQLIAEQGAAEYWSIRAKSDGDFK